MKLIEFQKVGDMLSREHKISIIEGRGWAANIKNRSVFYKKDDIYNLPEDHILGFLLHEIAHIHYTTDVDLPDKNKELMSVTLNMIEDISIESIIGKDYPNAEEILTSTKGEVLDTLIKMLPTMKNISIHEKSLLYAAARFEGRGYAFGISKYEKLGEKISQIMVKKKKDILERKETKNLLPLVKEVVDLMIKEEGEPTEEKKEEMAISAGSEGNATSRQREKQTKKEIIENLKAGQGWKKGPSIANNVKFIDEITDQATRIGKQLRSVLKRNNAMEYAGRYRSGKLLAKRFVRVKTLNDRHPFTRRIVKSNQSYAFAIASDVSGSMFGGMGEIDPGSYALSSLHMVGEALKYASIPRSLTIFGEYANTVAPMGKTQIRWEQLANDKDIRKADQGGTSIDRAINACTVELEKVTAERKIMIILTDGQSYLQEMKDAHKKATKAGIECLGITIGYDSGAYMDQTFSKKKNITISNDNTEEIGKAFIKILKTSVSMSK